MTNKAHPGKARWGQTENLARQALERLINGTPTDPTLQHKRNLLTVTALAIEAGTKRNIFYTTHQGVREALETARELAKSTPDGVATADDEVAKLRAEIHELKTMLRQLTTNNAILLKRAQDAEWRLKLR